MLKKHNIKEGFTIIEVIIVLVIAAVIMLAVFLVVPQLQRSAANNTFQSNARSALTAAQQFAANSSGATPTVAGIVAISGQFKDATGAAKDVTVAASGNPTPAPGIVAVVYNAKCATSSPQNSNTISANGTGNTNFAVVVGLKTSAADPVTGSNSYYCINN